MTSLRTKRRKIAAEVSQIIEEVKNTELLLKEGEASTIFVSDDCNINMSINTEYVHINC